MPDNVYNLTIGQAAKELGFSIDSVRKWAESGALRGIRTPEPGRRWRFRQADLDAFVVEQSNGRREVEASA